ncbi:DeoR-family transcriptional regulator [Symbiobacterium thermophilum IAM 14863]|uniref:DeoR-family transcriptional regulator n=3 Tax=Symbiobacterium thermophilum TaxID=2734 RepID=Q67M12_SYMTH|nr:DeoR-family transcriptional regulator [Symbiobacterium thermophilum IAM 14863]
MCDMNIQERLDQILKHLQQHGQVQVRDLAQQFGVSEMTIRRDLERLAREGHLVRTYGGATAAAGLIGEQPFAAKAVSHIEEKERIARAAADLVQDGDVVLLDAGSTTLAISRCLRGRKGLTVITVDLKIALELCDEPGIEVIVTGGTAMPEIYSLLGPVAEQFLRGLTVNIAFLGSSAVDVDFGLTTPTLSKVPLKRAMIGAAQHAVLVADSSKFNRRATYQICPLSSLSRVITDDGLPPAAAAAIRKGGITLDLV